MTFSGNSAGGSGAGIYRPSSGVATIDNVIVAFSTNGAGIWTTSSGLIYTVVYQTRKKLLSRLEALSLRVSRVDSSPRRASMVLTMS